MQNLSNRSAGSGVAPNWQASPALPRSVEAVLLLFALISQLNVAVLGQTLKATFDLSGNLESQTSASTLPPQILAPPQLQIVQPGELASFSVVVADTRGLSYQWRFNGTNLSGATSDALLLTNVNALNEGPYAVVLYNSSGSVTSAPAMLWIDADGDGLPDTWEQTYFGGLGQNPTADFDGDGIPNLTEFNDGTNPTNTASAMFRLTLMSDGGTVTVTPNKLAYINGEVVSLTATALPPQLFHGWTGDYFGTTNQITLVMTNNKTVTAYFQAMVLTWTNIAGGNWHSPSNWSPNFVPLPVDDAILANSTTVTINNDATCRGLTMAAGTLTGASNLTVYGDALWSGGDMSGSGRTVIAPRATLTLNSPSSTLILGRLLENAGTVVWAATGNLTLYGAVITNRPGALFHVQNAQSFSFGNGSPRFDNAGTFRKSANTSTTTVNVNFNNYGSLDLRTGFVSMAGGYAPASTSVVNFTLGGTTAGIGYGQLQSPVTLTLAGALNLALAPGFLPPTNSSYTVVSAGARSGTFSSFAYPSNRVAMTLSYLPTSVLLTVSNVFPITAPVLLTPAVVGTNVQLSWTASSNIYYQLEYKTSLSTTNWYTLGDMVTSTSNAATQLDALTSSNRFYRIRALP